MLPLVQSATRVLSLFVLLLDILAFLLVLAISIRKIGIRLPFAQRFPDFFREHALGFSFCIAFASTASSLFYSEIAGFAPCVLCWWQRIFLYPQVFILGIAWYKKEAGALMYTLPLSVIGGVIAFYHSYLQFGGLSPVPCPASGPSCTQVYFLEYGYITIPTMALTSFLALIVLAMTSRSRAVR